MEVIAELFSDINFDVNTTVIFFISVHVNNYSEQRSILN
jgi:hypothetical protein